MGPGAGHSRRGLQRMISRGWGWFYFSVTAEQSSLVESLKRTVTLLVSISQGSSLSIIVFSSRGLAKCLWAAFTSGAQGSLPSSPVGRIQFIPHRSLSPWFVFIYPFICLVGFFSLEMTTGYLILQPPVSSVRITGMHQYSWIL